MSYTFDNERPIYIQLVEMLKTEIVSGRIQSGARLPSVRELASQVRVNPNTLQKALLQLESEGLIYTERTNGKFVTEDEERIAEERIRLARAQTEIFLKSMAQLGVTEHEVGMLLTERGTKIATD